MESRHLGAPSQSLCLSPVLTEGRVGGRMHRRMVGKGRYCRGMFPHPGAHRKERCKNVPIIHAQAVFA